MNDKIAFEKKVIYIDKEAIGRRIKNIRLRLGLTMEEFIERIDGKPGKGRSGTVNNWETGKNAPSKQRLRKIADMAGISVNFLLYGDFQNRIDKIAQYAQIIWEHRNDKSDTDIDNIVPLERDYLNELKEVVGIINTDKFKGEVGSKTNFTEGIKYVSQKVYDNFKEAPIATPDYESIVSAFSVEAREHYNLLHATNETLRRKALEKILTTIAEVQDNAHGVPMGKAVGSEPLSPNVDKHFLEKLISALKQSFNTISKLK